MSMAEIYLLDKNLNWASGPLEEFTSLVWSPAWWEVGSFTLSGSPALMDYIREGAAYIWMQGRGELGIIDDIEYSKSSCVISGGFAEGMLGWRCLLEERTFSGAAESAVLAAVSDNLRNLPLVSVGQAKGYPEEVNSVLERGMPLDEAARTILRPLGMTFALRYTGGEGLELEIIRGKDRSQGQTENSWAIFSESFENITQCVYTRRRGSAKNAAIVYGDYGGKMIYETVDRAGEDIRREISSVADVEAEGMSEAEYRAVLRSRGEELLAEYQQEEAISGEAEETNLIPGEDYDVGDIVEVAMEDIGLAQAERITGMDIVLENGGVRYIPKFGAEQMGIRSLIRREMKRK